MTDPYDSLYDALDAIDFEDLEQRLKGYDQRLREIETEINQLEKEKQEIHKMKGHFSGIHHMLQNQMFPKKRDVSLDGRLKDKTIVEACKIVLSIAQRPLHLNEVVAGLKAGGYEFRTDSPKNSVESSIQREPDVFEKVGPRTYRLKK